MERKEKERRKTQKCKWARTISPLPPWFFSLPCALQWTRPLDGTRITIQHTILVNFHFANQPVIG